MFSISILAEQSDAGVIGSFGFQSGREQSKFDGIKYQLADGLPVLADTCGYIVCKVIDKMETATHTVFLGEVTTAEINKGGDAMTYAYYHNVIKGKSPKNAPTYLPLSIEKAAKSSKKYTCKVCGYEYMGAGMPADYTCPICGVGANTFLLKNEL
jgi:rubredoxin